MLSRDSLLFLFCLQFERDVMIWNNKKYVSKPLLVKEDSAIQKHRRWFSQFYSENSPRLQYQRDKLDFWPPRTTRGDLSRDYRSEYINLTLWTKAFTNHLYLLLMKKGTKKPGKFKQFRFAFFCKGLKPCLVKDLFLGYFDVCNFTFQP